MAEITVDRFIRAMATPFSTKELFDWPPDVFAITSAILRSTGAYRHLVSPPDGQEAPPALPESLRGLAWDDATSTTADEWLSAVSAGGDLPAWLESLRHTLTSRSRQWTIEQLRNIESAPGAWPLCCAILSLHAIADCACSGFGTATAPRSNPVLNFLADHLLSTYGSLSRLPKASGVVLPKMRTPQSGLTLRATSLYATWHQTEVETVWRSTPWVNSEENTLNVLVLPVPHGIQPSAFKRSPHPVGRRNLGMNRYFTYEPSDRVDVHRIVGAVRAAAPMVSRVHLLVLPELALDDGELRDLQDTLSQELDADQVPLVITGVRSRAPGNGHSRPARNSVVLSAHFAGKWYDMRQDKHHRWKLDRRQVEQYTIGGTLGSNRHWWEDVAIPQRSLSVLAPTGWLALCPLICEDLAQLEPVSELIRGIGPTLLVALLLDGPQLPTRWSARYASVMADDPGTSVLTVTSRGMAARSRRRPARAGDAADSSSRGPDPIVALWRDSQNGFRELTIGDSEEALVLTLTADWHEEHSLDGRADGGAAARFVLTGTQPILSKDVDRLRPTIATGDKSRAPARADRQDLFELTTFTQLVDAALDADPESVRAMVALARNAATSNESIPVKLKARSSRIASVSRRPWGPTPATMSQRPHRSARQPPRPPASACQLRTELIDKPPFRGGRRSGCARSARLHDDLACWLDLTPARVVNRLAAMGSNGSKPCQAQGPLVGTGQLTAGCGVTRD